ncbi:MAG: SDR family oxidoreductase [Actinomycetota bacterium]|nr:SDR family oxidoreductase [Actinomycetota bacterium]
MPEVVVVTGASAGVGRATVREFARRSPGARIGLLARGRDGLEGARQEVEALGGRALVLPTDVSDAGAVEEAAGRVEEELGSIDVWVNNAMTAIFAPVKETTPEEYRRITEVTYLGYVHGTMAALKRMLPRDRGTIVQVGSALAYRGIPLQAAYCGSKHAIKGFTESVRTELLHDGSNVHLTMVQLPALNTPQFGVSRTRMPYHPQPVPPIYQPEFAAKAVYWSAHNRRREVYAGTSVVATILGNKLLPGLAERYLARTGYDAQQADEPVDTDRPDYLFEPVPDDRGARGIFDEEARESDPQFWATKNRGRLAALAAAGLAGAAYAFLRRTR